MFAKFKYLLFIHLITIVSWAQTSAPALWQNKPREARYHPEGEDFVIVNGSRRFNRSLYGGNTAFRVEAGDLPEFGLYLPGMGGNLQFALVANDTFKWLIRAKSITAQYRPGSMIYDISDPVLQHGAIHIKVLPLYNGEGMVVKVENNNIPQQIKLMAAFGGVSGTKFSRDGDLGADPESSFYLKPEYCANNIYSINKQNAFTLHYGAVKPLTEEERYEVRYLPSQNTDINKKAAEEKICSGIFPPAAQLKLSDPVQFYRSAKTTTPALAALIGEDPAPYLKEAQKILTAINNCLWMPAKGWYAEYKDLLGLKQYRARPLEGSKELESVVVRTMANDVVIGLMSMTLVRDLNH